MKENFDTIMDFILSIEGGYVNDPNDPGGETNFGISKRKHPNEDIKGMTAARAKEIYKAEYWDRIGGDNRPFPMDVCLLDTSIHMGVDTALTLARNSTSVENFLLLRIKRYLLISRRNANLRKFYRGWTIRVIRLYDLINSASNSYQVIPPKKDGA